MHKVLLAAILTIAVLSSPAQAQTPPLTAAVAGARAWS